MTRRLRVTVPISLLVGWLVPPGAAHDSPNLRHNWRKHYLKFAKKAFYTKRVSNTRFVNATNRRPTPTSWTGWTRRRTPPRRTSTAGPTSRRERSPRRGSMTP